MQTIQQPNDKRWVFYRHEYDTGVCWHLLPVDDEFTHVVDSEGDQCVCGPTLMVDENDNECYYHHWALGKDYYN